MFEVRPGFNLDVTFKEHLSNVRIVVYNPNNSTFISADDKNLKAWNQDRRDGKLHVQTSHCFPANQSYFVTSMVVSFDLNVVFVACLDGCLRIYDHKLDLMCSLPWSNGVVRQLVYNSRREELITAGSYGVKIWECEIDLEAYRTDNVRSGKLCNCAWCALNEATGNRRRGGTRTPGSRIVHPTPCGAPQGRSVT